MIIHDESDRTETVDVFQGSLSVHEKCVHATVVNSNIHRHLGTIGVMTVIAPIGSTSVTASNASAFQVADRVAVYASGVTVVESRFPRVTGVSGDVVTLDSPIDIAYAIGSTIETVSIELNATGSLASPITYVAGPPTSQVWHITNMTLTMSDNVDMDDGKFGGMTALTNGVTVRTKRNNVYHTLTNWKNNSAIIRDTGLITYASKAPAGTYGLSSEWNIKEHTESSLILNGATSDKIEVLVQDNLSDLLSFRIKVQGHIEGE